MASYGSTTSSPNRRRPEPRGARLEPRASNLELPDGGRLELLEGWGARPADGAPARRGERGVLLEAFGCVLEHSCPRNHAVPAALALTHGDEIGFGHERVHVFQECRVARELAGVVAAQQGDGRDEDVRAVRLVALVEHRFL